MMLETSTTPDPAGMGAATGYYDALQQQANAAAGRAGSLTFVPIENPSQGDFAWSWQDADPTHTFNGLTYDYIDARVFPATIAGTAALGAPGSFTSDYASVLDTISFALSHDDWLRLNSSSVKDAQDKVVASYENALGPITVPTDFVGEPIDYVINVIVGTQWAGKDGPLTYRTMAAARNLNDLLPLAPMSADPVITSVSAYLDFMAPLLTLEDESREGSSRITDLRQNARAVSVGQGGMSTYYDLGGPRVTPKWTVSPVPASIKNQLASQSTITLEFDVRQSEDHGLQVSIDGQAWISVGSAVNFSLGAAASFDMTKTSGTSTECHVRLEYEGWTVVAIEPDPWQETTAVGYYDVDVIQQAVKNTTGATGYSFTSTPPFDLSSFHAGGTFGRLTHLLICNRPKVTISYAHADFATFSQHWSEKVTANLDLFGVVKLGGVNEGAYGSSASSSGDNTSFDVTFVPNPQLDTVPERQQTVFVIGGAIENPGAPA